MILVRHGQSTWNREHRIQGQLDPPLSGEGRRQAELLGRRLAGRRLAGFYASDLKRAFETAQAIESLVDLKPDPTAGLREIYLREWEGLRTPDIPHRFPAPSRHRAAEPGPLTFQDPERIHLSDRGAGGSHGHRRLERRRSPRAGACHRARTRVTQEASRWDDELEEKGSPAPLLQSWAWGEVQARAGWKIERVSLKGGAIASVQVRSVGPAPEAYVPRGPVPPSVEAIDALVESARPPKMARLLLEPEAPADLTDALTERGFSAVAPTQPQHTRILQLRQPDEMLKP